jgi:cytochrome c oxidase subunit 2
MIENLLPSLSTYSQDIDGLFSLIFWLVGFWLFLTYAVFFYFIFKFKKKDGQKAEYYTGEEKELKRWVTIPHFLVLFCDLFILYGAVTVWSNVKQQLPPAEATVRVIGQQWAWTFIHPGPDGVIDTADDITTVDELHVKVDTVYHYKLESNDVLHDFSVPVFRLKQDAVPGRVITGWFEATKTGEHDVQCAEICGIGHGLMAARIFIETPEQHTAWMAGDEPVELAANAAPATVEE